MTNLLLSVNIFNNDVAKYYTKEDATLEIILMLLGAFLLGVLFRHFMGFLRKKEIIMEAAPSNVSNEDMLKSNLVSDTPTSVAIDTKELDLQVNALKKEVDRLSSMKICNCNLSSDASKSNLIHSPAIDSVQIEGNQKIEEVKTATPIAEVKEEVKSEVVEDVKAETMDVAKTEEVKEEPKNEIVTEEKSNFNFSPSVSDNSKPDDLKVIEGIGPAIENLLNEKGIFTYEQLSLEQVTRLEQLLDEAGPRFRVHVPETWPEQAKLLKENRMEEFKTLTENLKGGRRV